MSRSRGVSTATRLLNRQWFSSTFQASEAYCCASLPPEAVCRTSVTVSSRPVSREADRPTLFGQGTGCEFSGSTYSLRAAALHQRASHPLSGQYWPSSISGRLISTSSILECSVRPKPKNEPQQEEAAETSTSASHDAVWNLPNGISVGRMLAGPLVAYLILEAHWPAAFVTLGVAGASDWLDGYVAKSTGQGSVLGSYLDPLADKVLMGCTAGALAYEGSLPPPLAILIIGRDVFLVAGAFAQRFRDFRWRWPGWSEFFRTAPPLGGCPLPSLHESAAGSKTDPDVGGQTQPAQFVEPLYVSKVNTVAQLGLVAGCISHSWYGWPLDGVLWVLGGSTAVLTVASGWAYLRAYRAGNLHART